MGWFSRLIEDGAKEWHMRARVATGIRPGSNPPAPKVHKPPPPPNPPKAPIR